MKTCRQRTLVHTRSSSRHPKRLCPHLSTRQTRPQCIQKNIHISKNRYHWKGIKKSVYQHCTNCQVCAKHNIKTQQLKNEHFSSPPQPMEFIAMHLIGEFHPASSKGNRFALTAVCMLTGFPFCIPLKSKCAEDVIKAYIGHICCTFGPSRKILTDNGTEFKTNFGLKYSKN